ncbi:hypothetical protein [Brucella pituitosa]|uniref:hypothetical protein n=1 Tax=Brucella pituitosa TaxID=571256 RepID=UPI000CFFE3CA|nr:hypothetical protein CQ062_19435 [Ochrobactrum sp. MYb68]
MTVPTNAERLWFKRLQKVLDECPSDRIAFYTIGDTSVTPYDFSREAEILAVFDAGSGEFGNAVTACEADFPSLRFPNPVASTTG